MTDCLVYADYFKFCFYFIYYYFSFWFKSLVLVPVSTVWPTTTDLPRDHVDPRLFTMIYSKDKNYFQFYIYIYTHISFYPRLMMTVDLNFELYVCISCTYLYKNIVSENWGTLEHLAPIVSVDLNFSSCELILGFPIGILQPIVLCLDLWCGQEL